MISLFKKKATPKNYKVRDYVEDSEIFYLEIFEPSVHALIGEMEFNEVEDELTLNFKYEILKNDTDLEKDKLEGLLGDTLHDIIAEQSSDVNIKEENKFD